MELIVVGKFFDGGDIFVFSVFYGVGIGVDGFVIYMEGIGFIGCFVVVKFSVF